MTMPTPFQPLLDWHQSRRVSGIPTVTTLVGPTQLAVRVWRGWLKPRAVSIVRTASSLGDLAAIWANDALAGDSGLDLVRQWLSRITHQPLAAIIPSTGHTTRYDLEQLWRSLPIDRDDPAARIGFLLLEAQAAGTTLDWKLIADPLDIFRGLSVLTSESPLPSLLVAPATNALPGEWLRLFSYLEAIAAAVPQLPVAMAVSPTGYDVLTSDVSSRLAAMAREGFLPVEGLSEKDLTNRLEEAGIDPLPNEATLRTLVTDGLEEEGAQAFVEAARMVRHPSPVDIESDFRSLQEKFLFEQLEAMPETSGLFKPNVELPFHHGNRAGEADLLAARLKLVVEVDGSYYHLNPQQYRRDRRKDLLYQQHGYFVLRFLAEDVVDDFPSVRSILLKAVALQRDGSLTR
jgi:hypothetical protein